MSYCHFRTEFSALEPDRRPVVGMANQLLDICQEHGLRLDWQDDRCFVRPVPAGPQEATVITLPKSVLRGLLARMAALCNEESPGSVSPYGGEGQFRIGRDASSEFRVSFTNTADQIALEVRRLIHEGAAIPGDPAAPGSTLPE